MSDRGDIALGTTHNWKFTTRRFTTGAPFALSGGAVAAYVDGSTTEITAGLTLTADFDARTGYNNVAVVATSGNGFAAATDVSIAITAGTVDGVSVVGEEVISFSIENRSALRPATAGRTLQIESDGMAHADLKEWLGVAPLALSSQLVQAIVSAAAAAGISDSVWDEALAGHLTVGSTGAALNAAGSAGDPWVTALPGAYAAGQAGNIVGNNLNATVSSRATQTSVDNVQADTDNIQTRLPAALVGGRMDSDLRAINGNTSGVAALDRATATMVMGVVGAGSSTGSIVTTSLDPAPTVADQLKGRVVFFDENTATAALRSQATDILASSVGGVLTVSLLTTAPAAGDTFVID